MDAVGLIAEARAAGLHLEVDGDRLIVQGPRAAEPIVRRLREAKPDVLRALSGDASAPVTLRDATSQDEFITRARERDNRKPASPSVTRHQASPGFGWPAALPGLGVRRVIAFSECHDCETDPPDDVLTRVGAYEIAVPGQRHTFIAYADWPLCRRHATRRSESR